MAAQLPWDIFQLVGGIPEKQCQAELHTVRIQKKPMHHEQRVVCLEDNCLCAEYPGRTPRGGPDQTGHSTNDSGGGSGNGMSKKLTTGNVNDAGDERTRVSMIPDGNAHI